MKKVSIIIPYRIDRGWLDIAIRSAEKQSYENIEILPIMGDCNCARNINKGIANASGDYIKILAEDDWLSHDGIWKLVQGIRGYDFIHANAYNYIQRSGKYVEYKPSIKYPTLRNLLKKNVIHNGTVLYDMKMIENLGVYDETLETAEEYEYHLRALQKGCRIGYIDEYVYYYRRHRAQKSLGINASQKRRNRVKANIKARYE